MTRKLIQRIRLPEEGADAVSIDEDGKRVAWVLKKGGVAALELPAGKVIARDDKVAAKWIAISPDGSRLAISSGSGLEVRPLDAFHPGEALKGHEAEITNLAWSRDGAWLGSTAQDGRILVHDGDAKSIVYEVKKPSPLYALAFHPEKKHVAYGGQENKVYQYEFSTEREEVVSEGQPYWITCLGYSPDGRKLAVGDESCDIWLYDLAAKDLVFHNKHHVECWLGGVAWTQASDTFLFACRPNSHAGKPALCQELARAEASRSAQVREARDALHRALQAQLAQVEDPELKKTIEQYQLALASEEKVNGVGGQSILADPSIQVFSSASADVMSDVQALPYAVNFMNVPQQASSAQLQVYGVQQQANGLQQPFPLAAPPIVALPPEVQKLAQEHQEAVRQEMERLQSNFCLNQWKVKGD